MKKILLVDDDPHIRKSLAAILNSENYITESAKDKDSALKIISDFYPDLLLLDVNMTTDQEGFELALELKKDKNFSNTPVIILTSIEIISGNEKIINIARTIRNSNQHEHINTILKEDENSNKILEFSSKKTNEIVNLKVSDVLSKPIQMNALLKSVKNILK